MVKNHENHYRCSICDKTFVQVQGLYRHEREKHNKMTTKLLHCYHCNQQFQRKYLLVVHLKAVHGIPSRCGKNKKRIKCAVSPCEETFTTYRKHRNHLEYCHSFTSNEEKLHFENLQKFKEWKVKMEEQQKSRFVQDTSAKVLGKKNIKRLYYICHRTDFLKPLKNSKRHLKNSGSNKIGRTCPAMIVASVQDSVEVSFFSTHVGHECEIGRMPLSIDDRNQIAGKLVEGVTIQRILDDVREEAAQSGCIQRRIHLLEKKDLHNIKRDFSISYSTKFHENDALSVKLWVEMMKEKKLENNCEVLYYKEQGQCDTFFEREDFILIIMTEYQEMELCLFGSEKICIDGTHGLNAYGFQLYTIMVVDDFGRGVPVSFCFSNRSDTKLFEVYFNCIKDRVGIINTKVFMSDDAPAFYNAWCSVMGPAMHQLLCTWHIRRNWFENLNKITGPNSKDKKTLVFKTLKVLQTEVDKEKFHLGLANFLTDLREDSDTMLFGEYFSKTYCNRVEKWSYCERKYLGINTNMYLEALHKKIKYSYLEGKNVKRLDKSLNSLLVLVGDSAFEKIITHSKNKLTSKVLRIRESHKRSLNITDSMILVNSESNKWEVVSSENSSKKYEIQKEEVDSCSSLKCNLKCYDCNICVHNFKCTCLDNIIHFNICKHIHAVVKHENILHGNVFSEMKNHTEMHNISFPTLIPLGQSVEKNKEKITEINAKCELLIGLSSRSNLEDDGINKIIKHLDEAIKEANKGEVNFVQKKSLNINKYIEKQRFQSKKKKKHQGNIHPNPSEVEKNIIQRSFSKRDTSEVLFIHTGFDHSYA
ncbi:unnamed protein product [Phaedon cochleariae]|uniref:Uncharacterized protein n=1 Tax=Phaedon cochleariae TaxID=80249 RepID=A0A9N9SCI0_PHACE|nr:unnamed protein product [Phaedon cochleariae]